jgi:hypothetical protein
MDTYYKEFRAILQLSVYLNALDVFEMKLKVKVPAVAAEGTMVKVQFTHS